MKVDKSRNTFEETLLNFFLSLLLMAFICPIHIYGQSFGYIGLEQGLSNSTVTTIYKDRHGFMWFGTFDGLNRFDGYSFTKFRNHVGDTASLPDNYVTALTEDGDGNLWVGTTKGVGVFNERLLNLSSVYLKSPGSKRGISTLNSVNALKCDRDGNMYIGTKDLGLLYVKKGSRTANQIPLVTALRSNNVSGLTIDHNNNVWFLIDDIGLYYLDAKTRQMSLISSLPKNGNCIREAADGKFWIGTNNGLFSYDRKTKELALFEVEGKDLGSSRILNLCFEGNGNLWMATDGAGLIVLDIRNHKLVQTFKEGLGKSLSSNALYDIFIDEDSRKWIGTMRGGINILDPKKNRFQTINHEPYNNNSLVHNTVFSFCEVGNEVWVGTDGGGISIWNPKSNTFRHHVFNAGGRFQSGANQIPSMIKDKDQNI